MNVILTDRRLKTSATDHYYTSGEMAPLYDLSTSNLSLKFIIFYRVIVKAARFISSHAALPDLCD